MPGINISINGTTIGTSTDQNGHYEITAPVGAPLVFSFIGMQTKEIVVTEDRAVLIIAGGRENRA